MFEESCQPQDTCAAAAHGSPGSTEIGGEHQSSPRNRQRAITWKTWVRSSDMAAFVSVFDRGQRVAAEGTELPWPGDEPPDG